jgi:hypothetical protein
MADGLGIWTSAGHERPLRVVGVLVIAVGIIGLAAWPFALMHQRQVLAAGGETLVDTLHLVLGMVDTLLFLFIIAFGARAFGKRFLLYSIATILLVMLSGALTGLESPKVAENEPTPWIGISERVAVFGSMLWITVLAICLWRGSVQRRDVT